MNALLVFIIQSGGRRTDYIYIYIYIDTHIHTYIYRHTHIYSCESSEEHKLFLPKSKVHYLLFMAAGPGSLSRVLNTLYYFLVILYDKWPQLSEIP